MTVQNFAHNTTQNSSDNVPYYIQTNIIAQMLSIGGKGDYCTVTDKADTESLSVQKCWQ